MIRTDKGGGFFMTCMKWITEYLNWFKDEIKCIETEHGLYVNTPFLTIDNDYITLRINEIDDDRIIISDDSKTMQYLFLRDFELNNERLSTILMILNKLGLKLHENEIIADTTKKHFGRMFTNIINGINNVSSLTFSIRSYEKRTFRDEVNDFLIEICTNITSNYKIRGKSAEHIFEFMIPKKEILLIDPLSAKSTTNARRIAKAIAFKTIDIKQTDTKNLKFIAILDDDDTNDFVWDDYETKNILNNYVDFTFKWHKERKEIMDLVS